jgi:hypothetical protein
MLVSFVLLSVAMAALLELVAVAGHQRQKLTERRVALQEVANQAERIALLPWADTASDKLTAWQPSEDLKAVLPAAQCRIVVSEDAGGPAAREIQLHVRWANTAGQAVEPVSLTVWRYAPEAAP